MPRGLWQLLSWSEGARSVHCVQLMPVHEAQERRVVGGRSSGVRVREHLPPCDALALCTLLLLLLLLVLHQLLTGN